MAEERDIDVQDKLSEYSLFGQAICAALNEELAKYFVVEKPLVPDFASAEFSLHKDSYSGENALQGVWRDRFGQKLGEVIIHGDSSFHAEYDVIKPHPVKRKWFVEAVTAWGNREQMKSELKLLPVLS